MRTTVEFDDDTARAVADLRRQCGLGVSEAVNALIRRGLMTTEERLPFRQRTAALGIRADVSSIADALEALDGAADR